MAVAVQTIIVSEAYSAHNIGDEELVRATLEAVRADNPGAKITVVARGPNSFRGRLHDVEICGRLFDRDRLLRRGSAKSFAVLLSWGLFVTLESAFTLIRGGRRSWPSRWFLTSRERDTYRIYIAADKQVAVGGGYLGDRYLKESILTLWTWWWASRRGCPVEGMPMSIEAESRSMRALLSGLMPRTGFKVRDLSSRKVLADLGISVELAPDLAFRNYDHDWLARPKGEACMVFPVATDYFAEDEWKRVWAIVAGAVSERFPRVEGFSMHRALEDGRAGYDDHALAFLRTRGVEVVDREVDTYQDLCSHVGATARIVVTSRMHAAIAALCVGVPPVVLGYEEKHAALMKRLGLGDLYIPFLEVNGDNLRWALDAALRIDRSTMLGQVESFATDAGERR